MAASNPSVRIEGLEKRYKSGTMALKGVTFDVEEGEFFGLLGPNGAGKTTLISCLGGLTTPTAGRILVRGIDTHAGSTPTRTGAPRPWRSGSCRRKSPSTRF